MSSGIPDVPDIQVDRKGRVIAGSITGKTTKLGVLAEGDTVTGAATVIEAMGPGERADKTIDQFLRTGKW